MPKSQNTPKHHNFPDIPRELRAYLNQLETALASAGEESKRQSKRISALEAKLNNVERKLKVRS